MDYKEIYRKIEDIIPKDKVDALYLFGSYATGDFNEDSDIDLAIFSDKLNYVDIVDIEDRCSIALGKDVDLVLPEKDNAILLREILSGKCLIDTTQYFDEWFERFNEWITNEWWFIETCINERCGLNE